MLNKATYRVNGAKMVQLSPSDDRLKIWRYMDFTKFIDLLDKSALFFSRADKLGDPFEGSHGKAYVAKMRSSLPDSSDIAEALKILSSVYRKNAKFTFLNCWHVNEHESAAMWNLYVKSNEGIAIQSSVAALKSSFTQIPYEIYIGKVKYIDYAKEVMTGGLEEGERYPFFHKRKSFEHERELRLVIQDFRSAKSPVIYATPPHRSGIYVSVDVGSLIERIYLAPSCPKWQLGLLESVTRKYGLNKEIIQSHLNERPVY